MRNLANYKYNRLASGTRTEHGCRVRSSSRHQSAARAPARKIWKGPASTSSAHAHVAGCRAARRARERRRVRPSGGAPPCATRQVSPNHARDKSNSKTRPTTAKAQDARGQDPPETVIYGLCGLSADCAARTDLGARTRLVTPVVSTAHTHAMTYVRCANAARAPRERHAQSSRTESAATLQPLYMYDHRLARLLL